MKNQCDGCKLGLPIEKGIHIHPGETGWNRLHMTCTKDRYSEKHGAIAQLVEHWPEEPGVVGSNPTRTT